MKNKTLGMMIASYRKESGLTQLELAEKMGVTDKAVSKWERDLSCPDVSTLPKLAELFDVTVDELMQFKTEGNPTPAKTIREMIPQILKALGLAMGVGVFVATLLNALDVKEGMAMLGMGLTYLAIAAFAEK